MSQFALLLHGEPDLLKDASPEEMQAMIQKYGAWRQKITQEGKLVLGVKLTDGQGRVMRGKGSETVLDGPYPEAREVIGGLFVIEADSYQEAVEVSRGCPHLEYGTIEIREIERRVTATTP